MTINIFDFFWFFFEKSKKGQKSPFGEWRKGGAWVVKKSTGFTMDTGWDAGFYIKWVGMYLAGNYFVAEMKYCELSGFAEF